MKVDEKIVQCEFPEFISFFGFHCVRCLEVCVSVTKDQVQNLSETQAWYWGGKHSDVEYGEV